MMTLNCFFLDHGYYLQKIKTDPGNPGHDFRLFAIHRLLDEKIYGEVWKGSFDREFIVYHLFYAGEDLPAGSFRIKLNSDRNNDHVTSELIFLLTDSINNNDKLPR